VSKAGKPEALGTGQILLQELLRTEAQSKNSITNVIPITHVSSGTELGIVQYRIRLRHNINDRIRMFRSKDETKVKSQFERKLVKFRIRELRNL
jgi:hypothetical protein